MADEEAQRPSFVFTVDAVRRSIHSLMRTKTHEHVPGYLALLRSQAYRQGVPAKLADISELFHRYLKVTSAGERPFLRPFVSRGRDIWFNENIAGSFAPSNVKAAAGPFFQVAHVAGSGQDTTYSLPTDHASLALRLLLKNNKLPITATAAFLYRDYGFHLESPKVDAVVALFRDEFSMSADGGTQTEVFTTLFYDDSDDFSDADLVPQP